MKMRAIVTGIIIALFVCGNAYAGPVNLGFEEGVDGLYGWTQVENGGIIDVVTSYNESTYKYAPADPNEGQHFLTLTAGKNDKWVQVSQLFHADAGETIRGMVAFDANDTHRDDVVLIGCGTDTIYTFGSLADIDKEWTQWSWTATVAGDYTLTYSIKNTENASHPSVAMFDAVPIPPTILLFGTAMIGLLGIRRRSATS